MTAESQAGLPRLGAGSRADRADRQDRRRAGACLFQRAQVLGHIPWSTSTPTTGGSADGMAAPAYQPRPA